MSTPGGRRLVTIETVNYRQNAMFWTGVVVASLLAAAIITVGVVVGVYNTQNVKYISSVGPDGAGEITLLAGLGELIVTDAVNHNITVSNTGVVTINSLGPDVAGNFIVDVTAPGLSIANAGNTATLSNTGVTSLVAGAGVSVSGATGAVTVSNTGVITVNNLAADLAGNIVLAVNPGLSQTSVGNTVTLTNDGVLTVNSLTPTAGDIVVTTTDGLSTTSAGSTVTLADILTTQTALDNNDANGPLVDYTSFIGFITPVPEATWRTSVTPAWPTSFVPGSFDDGQGNVAGVAWLVPATGTYMANVDCEVIPSGIALDDHQSATVALCLGATSEDPLAAGRIPMGGYATLDLSAGANAGTAPPLDRRISFSTTFQAGCTNCLVQVAQPLTLHARHDHTGIAPPVTADFVCRLQVTRIK